MIWPAKHKQSESEKKREDEQIEAIKTVHDYVAALNFPSDEIDVRFYNHLLKILVDYERRIKKLEEEQINKERFTMY